MNGNHKNFGGDDEDHHYTNTAGDGGDGGESNGSQSQTS